MRVAFLVGDVRLQEPGWTTIYLALAAIRRGHEVGFLGADELTLTATGELLAPIVRPGRAKGHAELCAALADRRAPAQVERLTSWDVLFLRCHPVRERAGVVEFAERLRQSGVFVVNDPEGMLRAGSRTYLSTLPAEIRPKTLVTRDPTKVKAFVKRLGTAVVKPLLDKPGGLENVFVVRPGQHKNLNQILTLLKKSGYIVAQEYLPDVLRGEKRLLLLEGEPIRVGQRVAIYRRLRAQVATIRRSCPFGASEERILAHLSPRLRQEGLYFVGVDIVGEKVLQLNVFTSGGAQGNDELYGIDIADPVIRGLERRIRKEAVA